MIKVSNLFKSYVNGKLILEVLKGLNLTINQGEYVALMALQEVENLHY